jgi:metal-responsive CopG/Arc/MetJ family transcriptional regulator
MKTDRFPQSPAAVRLHRETLADLDRLAAERGVRSSDVIRSAVSSEIERHRRRLPDGTERG